MLKYKILNTDKDNYIDIPINLDFDPMDNSEIIEELIREERRKSFNAKEDKEVIRYKPGLSLSFGSLGDLGTPFDIRLRVWFYDCDAPGVFEPLNPPGNGWNYLTDYKGNGLITDGSNNDDRLKKGFERSFYTMDFYDTNNRSTQTKLFTVILQTVPPKKVDRKEIISDFTIKENDIGYYIYYLKELDFNSDIFMKLTFFNGITGKRTSFFNAIESIITIGNPELTKNTLPLPEEYKESMLYFRYRLNENLTYDIIDYSTISIIDSKLIKHINAVEVRFK
jgi:hypothetical protein